MVRAEFEVGLGWAAVLAMVAMVVIFIAVVGHARHMLLGPPDVTGPRRPAPPRWVAAPLIGGLAVCGFIGVFAWPLSGLLRRRHGWWHVTAPADARAGRSSRSADTVVPAWSQACRAGGCRRSRSWRRGCGSPSCPATTTGASCGSSTSSRPARPTPESSCTSPSIPPCRRCRPCRASRSRPVASNASSRTSSASSPVGHPQPRRLVLHQHWPEDWYPMRRGSRDPPPMVADAGAYPFVPVEGTGVYEIPVGPVHAGLIEPGHFRFWVVGETILRMKARLWFVHKGIERLFEGRDPQLGPRAGRADLGGHRRRARPGLLPGGRGCVAGRGPRRGDGAPRPPPRARTSLQPRRRCRRACATTSASVSPTPGRSRCASTCCRLNARVTGHRLLRGGVVLGGARVRLPAQ